MPPGPLPHVTVRTGPTLPGWTLRPALAAATGALLAGAAARTELLTVGLVVATSILLVAYITTRPGPTAAGVVLVATGLLLTGSALAPFDPWALLLTPLGYAVGRLAWLAGHVPFTARIERAALTRGWRRDATILGATTLLGVAALAATVLRSGVGVLVGGLALVGLVVLVALATSGPPRDDGGD